MARRPAGDLVTLPLLLFSGGLDSLITWRLLGKPRCLYVMLGHRYEQAELDAVDRLASAADIDCTLAEAGRAFGQVEGADGHIPYRNLHLATVAAAAGGGPVYLGALRGESSRDKSGRFLREASNLLSWLEGSRVRVIAPYRDKTKTELVAAYLKEFPSDADRDLLRLTRSCYAPAAGELPCGRCMACIRRWVALSNNGISEEYAASPKQAAREMVRANVGHAIRTAASMGVSELPGAALNQLELLRAMRGG